MQRHRFHASTSQISNSQITLDADEAHHLSRVLRLSVGDRVFVFDGEGTEWECEIAASGKREANLTILRQLSDEVESPLRLTLAQALVKGDKFDWVVQKATELGVTRIVPLITDHSDVKRAEERAEQKLERWRRISLEALKQCGRRRLVEILDPQAFTKFCETASDPRTTLFLNERTEPGGWGEYYWCWSGGSPPSAISVVIGPEGGWSQAELSLAEKQKFVQLSLGPRILRTETAGIVAVSLAQNLFGDLS